MAVENFAAGTLIIPMQEAFQNNGMWLAYGLVYNLLSNGIPVKWAINPAKVYNGTDFTASTQDIVTLTAYPGQNYTGGPYIIDSAYAAAALPLINAWQAANPATTVHRATSPFSAPIASTMSQKPRIALEDRDAGKYINYLKEAKIPDSLGNEWSTGSPDVYDATEIGLGAFFDSNADPCKQLAYDIFMAANSEDATWLNATNAAQLDLFLKIGGMLHANNHSLPAIENFAGPFLTTAGFAAFANQGSDGTFTVDAPSYPSAQAVPTSGKVQKLPSGSERTWLHTSVTYRPTTRVLAHFTETGLQYDFMIGGAYKGGTGAGKIVYEGGTDYSTSLPYSNNERGPYLRFFFDSIFFAVSKPRIILTTTPRNIPAGSATTVTFTLVNNGGSPAGGLAASVTLAPWATYNMDASVPPTSIVGQTLTWDAAALAAHQGPGTVLTFTAQVTPPIPGLQSTATYNATFADSFDENYTLNNYCCSINALPGASPNIDKAPVTQSANPNGSVTWTITASNNGTLSLDNVVITDTLPAGLTFVSAVPAPTTTVGGGGFPTVLTWQSPQIPASILPGGSTIITLTATAPPATTATFVNQVNLQGTDTTPSQYSVDTSATLQVNNRAPVPTVISPNGGELICQGIDIQWTAQDPDGDPLTYALQYSADGGATYVNIVSGLTGSCLPPGPPFCSYFWDTTALPSGSSYLVKVIASDGELSGEDVSNGPFTIDNTPPSAVWVFPPNGTFLTSTPVALQASATDNVGVVKVEFLYSTDGINFTSIGIDSIPSGGIYSANWEVTGLPQGAYILRAIATDLCGRTFNADIDVTMDLAPEVTLLTPQAGDLACPPQTNITWTASDPNGDPLTFTLQYSSNGGVTYTQIAAGVTGSSYVWNTTSLTSGSSYFVKVIASDGMLTAESANGPFTIDNSPPDISWIYPVNGALLNSSPAILQAMATDNIGVQQVQFQYSSDGITFTNIDGPVLTPMTDAVYGIGWDFSSLIGGQYYLRAVGTDTCGQTNQATIRVTADIPPIVNVLTPQSVDLICPSSTPVTWTASSPSSRPLTFTLLYSSDGGATYTQIISGVSGNSYTWSTTGLPSGSNYFIKVVASDGILTTEAVSGPFTIDNSPPLVTFLVPHAGDLLTSSPAALEAMATDNIGIQNVQFQYSGDGVTFTNIDGPVVSPATDSIYTIDWSFGSLPKGQYYLRAVAMDTCGQTAESTVRVTADLPPTVNLVSPNGGEVLCKPGTTIAWSASDPNGDALTYSLLYSSDNGVSYTIIATGLTGSCPPPGPPCSFFWDTTALPSGNEYLVKVVATDGILTVEDTSDGTFTIDNTPPTVNITSPAGNSFVHNMITIIATATDNVSVTGVTFEYSNDGGTTYHLIGIVATPLGEVYAINWNTIVLPAGSYTLRATARDQCNNTAESSIDITVDNTPPTVVIVSPPNNSVIRGTDLVVHAEDNECLTKVDLYIDGQLVHTETVTGGDRISDFIYDWDTNLYSEGPHVVRAVATDCAGLKAETQHTYFIDNLPEHYTQVLVDGILTIPEEKPDIEQIVDLEVTPLVDDINIFMTIDGTKVTLHGMVEIAMTYSSGEDLEEHFAHFNVPFSGMVLYPGLALDANVEPVFIVEHKEWRLLSFRSFKKDIVLFIGIRQLC